MSSEVWVYYKNRYDIYLQPYVTFLHLQNPLKAYIAQRIDPPNGWNTQP
jgi:hypothetical protein